MLNREEIVNLIYDNLVYIYCHNCRFNNEIKSDCCENCHRKMMEWQISKEACEIFANAIINGDS